MKRFAIALMMVAGLALSAAGCGKDEAKEPAPVTEKSGETAVEQAAEKTKEAAETAAEKTEEAVEEAEKAAGEAAEAAEEAADEAAAEGEEAAE